MKRVVIESPYAGNVKRNVEFCRAVCRYAVDAGYSPYASHLIFTQFLDDDVPDERQLGIDAGLAWAGAADEAWFCLRPEDEMSRGMKYALTRHQAGGRIYHIKRFTQIGGFLHDECFICGERGFTICADCAASATSRQYI